MNRNNVVIIHTPKSTIETEKRVAIVIHAFYAHQLHIIATKVNAVCEANRRQVNPVIIDIHITLSEDSEANVIEIIKHKFSTAVVHHTGKYGMDLLPFFKIIPILQQYDWVLKLHTKNTKTTSNCIWFDNLLQGLIGSPDRFFNTLNLLRTQPNWVIAGLMPFFVSAKRLVLSNQENIDKLSDLWGISTTGGELHKDWGFFAGSLYWLKPKAFSKAAEQLLQVESQFQQDFSNDGQMAHAVERLITKLAKKGGDIGLILPTAFTNDSINTTSDLSDEILTYTDDHPNAINNVTMNQLLNSYKVLNDSLTILQNVPLLDIDKYSSQVKVYFNTPSQAYQHFLLIGQFNGFVHSVPPLALKQQEQLLINWSDLVTNRQSNLVSIIIPIFNNFKLSISCFQSIEKYTYDSNYEVILINNGSKKYITKLLSLYSYLKPNIRIYHLAENLNFSIACNYGFSKSLGETVIFLNNDTNVTSNWLPPLQKALLQKQNIAVQPKLLYYDNTVQCAGIEFAENGFGVCRFEGESKTTAEVNKSQACAALTGACLAIKAETFTQVEGFDSWYINGQEDIDLCLRLRQTFPDRVLWYEANSSVYHHTYKSKGRRKKISQNRAIFKARWQ